MNRLIHALGLVLTISLIVTATCSCELPMSKGNAIQTAIQWCRLASLPEKRSGDKITVNGDAANREIEITFRADPASVQAWVQASPGLQDAEGDFSDPRFTFFVTPDQAAACTVQIDLSTGEVLIRANWA